MTILADRKTLWLVVTAVLVLLFEIFSLAGIQLPKTEAIVIFGTITLIVGYPTIWKGLKALCFFNVRSINLLMVIAVVGAFYIGEYPEAAVVIVLFTLAERLEDYGIKKSRAFMASVQEQIPRYAYLKGMDEPIDVESVKVGDLIVVKPHHNIPLDGEVISGNSFVDEAMITGEALPADKRKGDSVFAGTLNQQGVIEVRVTRTVNNSTLANIRSLTQKAMQNKAQTEKFIEKFSFYYTPSMMGLAVFWTLAQWLGGSPFQEGFSQALSLLVISCPCALVISTPISIYSAIGNAANKGIVVKGGRYLEAMGNLKMVAFDKTRTLTTGVPKVTDVIPYGKYSRGDLLACVAGVEAFSDHPFAKGIVAKAQEEALEPHAVEGVESHPGKGTKGECLICHDRHQCIGKLAFVLEEHHVPDAVVQEVDELQKAGKSVIVISGKHAVKGLIAFEDEVRQEGRQIVAALKKKGIKSVMLTGDHPLPAKRVAKVVGIRSVKAELLPQDKLKHMKSFVKKYGTVGMVGDGVNDAPALAAAQAGISLAHLGNESALEAASIIILNDNLSKILDLVDLGRRTLQKIRFNTWIAIVIKFFVVALALLRLSNLALAIFADVGVTIFVTLNSLRLLRD